MNKQERQTAEKFKPTCVERECGTRAGIERQHRRWKEEQKEKQERQAVVRPLSKGLKHSKHGHAQPLAPESVTPRLGNNRVRGRANKSRREPTNEAMKPVSFTNKQERQAGIIAAIVSFAVFGIIAAIVSFAVFGYVLLVKKYWKKKVNWGNWYG